MLDNLAQLHNAIVAGLRAKLSVTVPTVDAYPVIKRSIVLPAVLVELDEMEPGNDPGTGETALIGRFQARAIIDSNTACADLQVRELAALIAVAVTHETWGLPIEPAKFVQAGPDGFKTELDGYLVWVVEWTHQFHLAETVWPYTNDADSGKTLLIGLFPGTGEGNEARYMNSDDEEPPPGWGNAS